MKKSQHLFVTILWLCISFSASCQEWSDIVSQFVDDDLEDYSEDELNSLEELFYNKINLNDLQEEDVAPLFFLTDFEKQSLCYYVSHVAPLYSVYELQFVLGLPIEKAKLLAQFCYASPVSRKKTINELLTQGKHVFASNVSIANVKSREYKDFYNYEGGAQKQIIRYRFQSFNTLFFGCTFKKDMGESFTIKKGFDSQSAYLQIKDRGLFSNIILGDYRLSIAQGLVVSQGGMFGSSMEPTGSAPLLQLSKHSSTSEYLFSRGAAATVKIGKIKITPFVSIRKLDGAYKNDSIFPFSISKTGYHRTHSEIANKKQISYSLIGIHSQFDLGRMRFGSALVRHTFLKDTVHTVIQNASLFYNYFRRHIRLYGEVAIDNNGKLAAIQGMQFALSDEVMLSHSLRMYQSKYSSFMSSAVGKQSNIENEIGFSTNLKIVVDRTKTILLSHDLFCMPHEHTNIKVPSKGNALKCKITYTPCKNITTYYQCSFAGQTEKGDDGFEMSSKRNHKLYASLSLNDKWRLKVCMQLSRDIDTGILLYEDIVWETSQKVQCSFRFAQFDAPYDNRLYAWEDDVGYFFSSSQYFYAGKECYAVVKWDITSNIALQAKVSNVSYNDKYSLPDSYELYPSMRKMRYNVMFQISL